MNSLKSGTLCLAFATVSLLCGGALADTVKNQELNQFRPGAVWPDNKGVAINAHGGGMLKVGERYYWFGEHKVGGKLGNTAQVGVHAYSSTDLYNWKDEGIALAVSDDPDSDIVKGSVIERPKVIHNAKTGKYVMWFHLEFKGRGYKGARVGIAVADQPAGPYTFLYSMRPNPVTWPLNVTDADKVPGPDNFLERDFAAGQMARDMTLFVDDDGSAYLVASSEENHTLHVSKLSDDYLKLSHSYTRVVPGGNNEAPAIFKHQGRYYMITSGLSGWAPNAARSFVADSVFGPWQALGNPVRGDEKEQATTFGAQSTYILPHDGGYIFMADRWNPKDAIDGRYVWLPIEWEDGKPIIRWREHWSLSELNSKRH
jgi:beta-xylosidase